MVGVNRFVESDESPRIEVFRVDPAVEQRQIARLQAVRAGRSVSDWQAAIAGVEAAARGGDNLMPPILHAVEAKATVGELADALRRVFGEYEAVAD